MKIESKEGNIAKWFVDAMDHFGFHDVKISGDVVNGEWIEILNRESNDRNGKMPQRFPEAAVYIYTKKGFVTPL